MLVAETIGRIRHEHLVKGKSIKVIPHDLKISRNPVRKILRPGETWLSYGREVRPRLGRWKVDLDRPLTTNAGNMALERLNLICLYGELRPWITGVAKTRPTATPAPGAGSMRTKRKRRSCHCRSRRAKPTNPTGATRSS